MLLLGDSEKLRPIFLLADSQLLFCNSEDCRLMAKIRLSLTEGIDEYEIKAAYIGASNHDAPQFYEISQIALRQIGIQNCRLIKSNPDADDTAFLEGSNIILLAGGDTELGWSTIRRNGWDKIITNKSLSIRKYGPKKNNWRKLDKFMRCPMQSIPKKP